MQLTNKKIKEEKETFPTRRIVRHRLRLQLLHQLDPLQPHRESEKKLLKVARILLGDRFARKNSRRHNSIYNIYVTEKGSNRKA